MTRIVDWVASIAFYMLLEYWQNHLLLLISKCVHIHSSLKKCTDGTFSDIGL